jgi:uncharacterized protein YcfL
MKNAKFLIVLLLVGCSSSGPIATGNGSYMITKQSAGGAFVSSGEIKVQLIKEGTAFCKSTGKSFLLSNSTEKPADWVTNPTAEINFTCV